MECLANKTGIKVIADGEKPLMPSLAEFGIEIGFPDGRLGFGFNGNPPITIFGVVDCGVAI